MNRSIHGASKRISGIDRRKQPVLDRLNTNSTWMMNVATECKHAGNDDDMPEVCTTVNELSLNSGCHNFIFKNMFWVRVVAV